MSFRKNCSTGDHVLNAAVQSQYQPSSLAALVAVHHGMLASVCWTSLVTCGRACAQEHPFRISNWGFWQRLFGSLPPKKLAAAAALGVTEAYIMKRCSLGRSDEAANARHERFAAACALEDMIDEKVAGSVARRWAPPGGLSTKGGSFFASVVSLL